MNEIKKVILENQSLSTSKSYDRVIRSYNLFRMNRPHSEELICEWLTLQAATKKPTTLRTEISLLFKYLEIECNLQITKTSIHCYLKTLESKHTKKKAPAFTKEDIYEFLHNTPNEPQFLAIKLYVMFCYFGALRTCEAVDLKLEDIVVTPEGLIFTVRRSKTVKNEIATTKIIPASKNPLSCPIVIFNLYKSKLPSGFNRLWVKYSARSGTFVRNAIGTLTFFSS